MIEWINELPIGLEKELMNEWMNVWPICSFCCWYSRRIHLKRKSVFDLYCLADWIRRITHECRIRRHSSWRWSSQRRRAYGGWQKTNDDTVLSKLAASSSSSSNSRVYKHSISVSFSLAMTITKIWHNYCPRNENHDHRLRIRILRILEFFYKFTIFQNFKMPTNFKNKICSADIIYEIYPASVN